jgi:hypothetical protein
MRIVLVAQRLHLAHMRFADAAVARFVKQDAGAVAVVDDGVAHQGHTLVPALAGHIGFRIARRHGVHQADAVKIIAVTDRAARRSISAGLSASRLLDA